MATAKTKAAKRKKSIKRTPRKATPRTRGIEPGQCVVEPDIPELRNLTARIDQEGGCVIGAYREPLAGHPLVLAAVPIDRMAPTPFQRDLSDTHYKRLSEVINRTGMFLDPVIAITAPEQGFWTPNGRHRLEAMRRLGAKSLIALIVPKREIAWQILALNTEKAHNLRERALEVIRIYKGLIEEDERRPESEFVYYLEEPSLVTLGLCYERKGTFAGGAYHSILRRTKEFSDEPLARALRVHEKHAALLFEVDERVTHAVDRLKQKGLVSPYLRAFVVARINPIRWIKDEPPPIEDVLRTMRERAGKFNVDKVNQQDLAKAGGPPEAAE